MYKYLFGPVPSRRLGMSLGVDLVPHKVCSMDCVYCECGATTKLTLERKEYVSYEKITEELEDFFANNADTDFITFSGAGEPTLNSRLGDVLKYIKKIRPHIPTAVLTNASLLWDKQVRDELKNASLVLPSLDAAQYSDFNKINKPAKNLTVDKYLQGLIDFCKEFTGDIWLEVLVIPGYNDQKSNIEKIRDIVEKIKPDKVQINTLDRPGTVKKLKASSYEELENIAKIINYPHTEIVSSVAKKNKTTQYRKNPQEAIIETILRRPCTIEDLNNILNISNKELQEHIKILEEKQKIIIETQNRGIFYRAKQKQKKQGKD